jgi:hypothetical protein
MSLNLTYPDLVRRLHDVERLAEPPVPGERGGCMSSYDRRSRYDPETDSYIDWDANDDGSGFIRREGEWIVAFEQFGPGVIWRCWSALPREGLIQMFVDGKQVVNMPFHAFFEIFSDELPPLNFPSLAPTLSRGRNRWIPIPYNYSCKIRLGPGWGSYFHFTYTAFPSGTTLPPYHQSFDRPACIAMAEADRKLTQRGWKLPRSDGDTLEQVSVTIPAGKTASVKTLVGNRAITGMRLSMDLSVDDQTGARVLRETTIQITWDHDKQPSVWAPVGDFFGSVPGLQHFRSLPLGATGDGFYSHWFMPFSDQAEISFSNDGDIPRKLLLTVCHRPLPRSAKDLLRFHAKWHRDALLDKPKREGRDIDWTLLRTEGGPGRFCGMNLHVWNHWKEPERRSDDWWYGRWDRKTIDWWWGEGDEKFFVDGEKFPSTFGTGSEDYVGYAWAAEPPFPTFESPYACQPYVELDGNGHTSVCRLHVADDIPFQKSFEGCIEKYKGNFWGDGNRCLYAVVVYWYQAPGSQDPYPAVPAGERCLEKRELEDEASDTECEEMGWEVL